MNETIAQIEIFTPDNKAKYFTEGEANETLCITKCKKITLLTEATVEIELEPGKKEYYYGMPYIYTRTATKEK